MTPAFEPDPRLIAEAVARLRRGGLVVMPTETVYGLAADARNPAALAKVYALKGRPTSRPLIVHLGTGGHLDEWACDVPAYARAWAARFWPGPLTLVLSRHTSVPTAVTGGQDTIAIRVPAHPVAQQLLNAFEGGLAAPSANRYGHISPTTAGHVRGEFGAETPLILDGGPCAVGIESTIVSCLDDQPQILRPGAITATMLAAAVGFVVGTGGGETGVVVPGQVASHYAPRTATLMLPRAALEGFQPAGRTGFLGFAPPPFPVEATQRLPADPDGAGAALYAALRALDAAGLERIVVEAPPRDPEWDAVRDRLSRATAPRTGT